MANIGPPKNSTSETTTSLTYVPKIVTEKTNQFKIPKKNLTDSNTTVKVLKTSIKTIKTDAETKNDSMKNKSKNSKQLHRGSTNSVIVNNNPSDVKNNKPVNISTDKSTSILNDPIKIKTNYIKKNESHDRPINPSSSLHTKPGKIVNKTPLKDLRSKLMSHRLPIRHRKKSENKVEKSNIKSVVIKDAQDNKKCSVKTKKNQIKSDRDKQTTSYASIDYKENYKDSKCSMENIETPMKNIKDAKKSDKQLHLNKVDILKKVKNTDKKIKEVSNKVNTSNKIKSKEKVLQTKSDVTSNKKTFKSPIKRKTSKTKSYRKIKLVINLICNNNSNPQYNNTSVNEKKSGSKTCTVSNVDLDFLNDFNIDEIVESLNNCEQKENQNTMGYQQLNKCQENTDKHSSPPYIKNIYKDDTDAMDLIKTLKGEEDDDDLMRISTENVKDLLFSNVLNTQRSNDSQMLTYNPNNDESTISKDITAELLKTVQKGSNDSQMLTYISNNDESTISKDNTTELLKMVQKGKCETFKMVSSIPCNFDVKPDTNVEFTHSNKTSDINKHETANETQVSIMKMDEDIDDCSRSQTENDSLFTKENLSEELVTAISTNNIKEKQNSNSNDPDPLLAFTNVNNNLYACASENVNQDNFQCDIEHKKNVINTDGNVLNQQNFESSTKCQHKSNNLADHEHENYENSKDLNNIVSENMLQQSEINNKDNNTSKKRKYHQEIAHDPDQEKSEKTDNDFKLSAKEEKDNTNLNNDKCMKTCDENDNIPKSSMDQEIFAQPNANKENKENQHNLVLMNTKLIEEASSHDSKVQKTRHEDNKEKQNDREVPNKKNQNDLQNINTETIHLKKSIPDGDKHSHTRIKTNDQIILNLEGRLHNISGLKYAIHSIIHNGRYSKIFKCKHPNGKYYALKMATNNFKCNLGKDKKDMLYSLINDIPKDNLFIVGLVKAFNFGEKWCFLMDYYPKNLEEALDEAGKPFHIERVQDYARQLVMAVMLLRNKNMVHLDIKPQHILINSSNNMLKLCGFDSLSYVHKMIVIPSTGTVNYRAPEVILGYRPGFEIDVWSTALVLFEMATNMKLFPGIYNNDILYKQICTLGCIPYNMINKSKYGSTHFVGTKFIRRSGFKGQTVHIVNQFYKNNKLCNIIYNAYYEYWCRHRNKYQQNSDLAKLDLFVTLLQKMLIMQPEARLPIEFVCANTFVYDASSYEEW